MILLVVWVAQFAGLLVLGGLFGVVIAFVMAYLDSVTD